MNTEKTITKIYKRKQKAHEELLACDIALDEVIRKLDNK